MELLIAFVVVGVLLAGVGVVYVSASRVVSNFDIKKSQVGPVYVMDHIARRFGLANRFRFQLSSSTGYTQLEFCMDYYANTLAAKQTTLTTADDDCIRYTILSNKVTWAYAKPAAGSDYPTSYPAAPAPGSEEEVLPGTVFDAASKFILDSSNSTVVQISLWSLIAGASQSKEFSTKVAAKEMTT